MKFPHFIKKKEKSRIEEEMDQLVDGMMLDRDDPEVYKKKAESVKELAEAKASMDDAKTNRLKAILGFVGTIGTGAALVAYESRDHIFTSKVPSVLNSIRMKF